MTSIGKFVAVVAIIAVFAMPAATMPLHCMLMTTSGNNGHPCHMMGVNPSAEQMSAVPFDHSCCQVSTAKTESITMPQPPSGKALVAPPAPNTFLSELPAESVLREAFGWRIASPSGPPQAVLCTFLI